MSDFGEAWDVAARLARQKNGNVKAERDRLADAISTFLGDVRIWEGSASAPEEAVRDLRAALDHEDYR